MAYLLEYVCAVIRTKATPMMSMLSGADRPLARSLGFQGVKVLDDDEERMSCNRTIVGREHYEKSYWILR